MDFMRARSVAGAAAAVVVALTASAVPAHAETAADIMRAELEQGVTDGYPAVLAEVRDASGVTDLAGGVADRATKVPATADAQVRTGSNTKPFIATVILQLAGEGKLSLDDTVDHWLPGLVTGNGNDGTKISIRQLLNHTSGLPDYLDKAMFDDAPVHPNTQWTPEQLVKRAMTKKPTGAPGSGPTYCNTNYILAGMIIKAVTGKEPGDEVQTRIIGPLDLKGTTYPTSDPQMHGNFLHGYSIPSIWIGTPPYNDVTTLNVQSYGAAGGMVSTLQDLAKFQRALLGGKLLQPAQQREVTTPVPASGATNGFSAGLEWFDLPCGRIWAKGGDINGFITGVLNRENGEKQVSYAVNVYSGYGPTNAQKHLYDATQKAICAA
ncbi:beta-lactamase family protein [Actinomadura barringtoniae]|uniref:Beta-lactamase family protein n=1 Tax=Actinomadura barringtoniae TaxID=1427535 RepID=A0A939T6Y0_9ACTN|nr:serine hydrolase domain-containing protein [Actinomadura barringtoniae]MBO2451404.1 beta-lactamase family protein [Actinomadura barringtoniae]